MISEWAHFINLAKRFQRYLNFSAPKKVFFRKDLGSRGNLGVLSLLKLPCLADMDC